MKNGHLLKIIIVGILGWLLSMFLFMSAWKGIDFIFVNENPGLINWGSHWRILLMISLTSTFFSSIFVGLAYPTKTRLSSTISTMPTMLFVFAGLVFILFNSDNSFKINLGSWITIIVVLLLSIPLANFGAKEGSNFRNNNSSYFGQRHRPLGIHWSAYIWLCLPIYLIYAQLWNIFYISVISSFRTHITFIVSMGNLLLIAAFVCQIYGLKKALEFLVINDTSSYSKWQKFLRIVLYLILFSILAGIIEAIGILIIESGVKLPAELENLDNLISNILLKLRFSL